MKAISLRIGDLSVAMSLALDARAPLKRLVESTGRSLGEVHNALQRLQAARLVETAERRVAVEPLLRFIRWGVPYAFPPTIGPMSRGIATARAAAWGVGETEPSESEFVWPDPEGPTRGQAFAPPYPRAPRLRVSNPPLRHLLALLDLVRIGGVREQEAATNEIGLRLRAPSA